MSTQAKLGQALLKSLIALREKKGDIMIEDVGAILENMASTLQPEASTADNFLRNEIQKMADYIVQAKQEITALLPQDAAEQRLTDASSQLSAVIKATEDATGTILDAADEIQSIVSKMGTGSDAELSLNAAAARIYEACNFQDLTGQRITRVVTTLDYIETKILKLVSLFGDQSPALKASINEKTEKAGKRKQADAHLLHGPQLPGSAPTQAQIDELFANLK